MIVFVKNPAAAAKSLQECPTLCDPIDGSPPCSPVPGILPPGKNTGVCCHFLFQCMKLKSENGVTQLCPTLSDPMDFSPPGSSIHGIFQARVLEWGAIALSARWTNEPQFTFLWAPYFCFEFHNITLHFKESRPNVLHSRSFHSIPLFYRWRNRGLGI